MTAPDKFLTSNTLVPINDKAKSRGKTAAGDATGQTAVQQLFDATFDHMAYDKSGLGWGKGSFQYACDVGKGNCTDFHSYFIGISRAVEIPARFEIGIPLPANKESGVAKGYHCWAFAQVDNQWWQVDISEAWKNPKQKQANFGQLSQHRITLSTGRDLVLEPKQQSGPLNYFVYPHLEVDGQQQTFKFEMTYSKP